MTEKLAMKDARLVQLNKHPGEDGTTYVLIIRALLTRTLATQLGCHDNCFAENGMPRRYCELSLDGLVIDNVGVVLDGCELLAQQASHFKVGRPKKVSETDTSLEVKCNLHFPGNAPLNEWFDQKNKQMFDMAMTPPSDWNAQQTLFEKHDPDNQPNDEDEDEPCIECANGIPFQPGSTTIHDSGQPCRRKPEVTVEVVAKAPPEIEGVAPLASAREAAGGTHARKRNRPPREPRPGGVVEVGVTDDPPQPASNASASAIN